MTTENHELRQTLSDDEAAKEALIVAVSIMRGKIETTANRLTAAKMVLDFTKQKPATSINATVKTAESFLDELADAEKKSRGIIDARPEEYSEA